MTVVMAVALLTATAVLKPASSGARPSVCRLESLAMVARPIDAPVMPQSLGYLEFDWSSADGGVPGFTPLTDNSNVASN